MLTRAFLVRDSRARAHLLCADLDLSSWCSAAGVLGLPAHVRCLPAAWFNEPVAFAALCKSEGRLVSTFVLGPHRCVRSADSSLLWPLPMTRCLWPLLRPLPMTRRISGHTLMLSASIKASFTGCLYVCVAVFKFSPPGPPPPSSPVPDHEHAPSRAPWQAARTGGLVSP